MREKFTQRPHGRVEMRLETSGRQELIRWVLSWMPDLRVLAPKSLRDRIEENLRDGLAQQNTLKKFQPADAADKPLDCEIPHVTMATYPQHAAAVEVRLLNIEPPPLSAPVRKWRKTAGMKIQAVFLGFIPGFSSPSGSCFR